MKIINKWGEINLSKWVEKVKDSVISSNVVASVLGTIVHIIQVYSPTWAKAHAQHNCVDGGGVRFGINSKHLQKTKTDALIVCSSYNAS